MNEWEKYTLGEDITTKLGDGLHGTPIYDDSGEYYFINGNNLVNGKIEVNSKTKKVSKEEYNKYKKDLSDRTILLGINGTIGNVAIYNNEKCILGKSACYLNIDEKFDKQYIKYVLLNDHFQNHIKNNATGTTIVNVSLKLLRDYKIFMPSNIEQQTSDIIHVIDIGTGSGCIPIALKKELNAEISAIDVSENALQIARENATDQNASINFLKMDFINEASWTVLSSFDIIISNPPYIPENEKTLLAKNVTEYEPHLALFVKDVDPFIFYKKIAAFAKDHLNKNGEIFVEIHEKYAAEVQQIFTAENYLTEIKKDMYGRERMIKAYKK